MQAFDPLRGYHRAARKHFIAMVPFVANLHQGEQGRRFLDTGQPGINHNETQASLYLQALV